MSERLQHYLRSALDAIFRPVAENGFWDEKDGKVVRGLKFQLSGDGRPVWSLDDAYIYRYVPLAMAGVMSWRSSAIGDDTYDARIRSELAFQTGNIGKQDVLSSMPSIGMGPLISVFSAAFRVFGDEAFLETARKLHSVSKRRFSFDNSEDSHILSGWCAFHGAAPDKVLADDISAVLETVIGRQGKDGIFVFSNPTTRRHQNQMYTLWAVGQAVGATGRKGYLRNIEKTLDYTVRSRMLDNGAIIWEDLSAASRFKKRYIDMSPPHWEYLYTCHQAFFVNAVYYYYGSGGDRAYGAEIRRAVDWIFGGNTLGRDLVEMSGIGVPMRMMTTGGRIDVKGQMFKGTYEIGSYISALTSIICLGGLDIS
jgi:hypothetical protein